jgi:protein SCO1/2
MTAHVSSKLVQVCLLALLACLGAAASLYFFPGVEHAGQRGPAHKQSDRFSNIVLTTQHGKPVRFYDDLVKDKAVIINLMYSGCGDTCPANSAELAKINDLLGSRMGSEIIMLSISIDPVADTPERLKSYWQAFGAKPGWLFLTGNPDDIDRLRRELGAYDLDPIVDADPAQLAGYITVGNDRTDRWAALPLLMHRGKLVGTLRWIFRDA